jgi:hypothetical protein
MSIVVTTLGTNTSNNGSSVSLTGTAIPVGSLIVIFCNTDGIQGGISDSVSNTYTTLSLTGSAKIFYCWNCKALTVSQTITVFAASDACISGIYATGINNTSNPYDSGFTATAGSNNTRFPTVTSVRAPTAAGSLVFGVYETILSPALQSEFITNPGGWSNLPAVVNEYDFGQGGGSMIGGGYIVTSSQTTYAPTLSNAASGSIGIYAFAPPTTFATSITETGSAADSPSAQFRASGSLTETGTATDSPSAELIYNVLETGTLADSDNAVLMPGNTLTETGDLASAQDTFDDVYVPFITEAGNATDTVVEHTLGSGVITEAGSASDTWNSHVHFGPTLDEAGTAIDDPNTTDDIFFVSVSEAVSTTDTTDSTPGFHEVDETIVVSDASDAQTAYNPVFVEAGDAQDATDVVRFDVSFVEAGDALDAYTVGVDYLYIMVETGDAEDSPSLIPPYSTFEIALLVDEFGEQTNFHVNVADFITTADTEDGFISGHEGSGINVGVGETGELIDLPDGGFLLTASVNETGHLFDFSSDPIVTYNVDILEIGYAGDSLSAGKIPASRNAEIVPKVRLVSIHDVFTRRDPNSDPTGMYETNPFLRRPTPYPKPEPPTPESGVDVLLKERKPKRNLKLMSIHDVLTRRAKNSDPTGRKG